MCVNIACVALHTSIKLPSTSEPGQKYAALMRPFFLAVVHNYMDVIQYS